MDRFQELYCRRTGLAPADFHRHLLIRALYPHARWLAAWLVRLDPDYFRADHEFVDDISQLERRAQFPDAIGYYLAHYSNHGFLRRTLRLRVSVRRMYLVVREIFPDEVPAKPKPPRTSRDSFAPFSSN